ncbi:MAG: ribonuclease, partial [Acidocella sp.]|nr:ribonuclease [Acidocella sp.]
MTIRLSGKTGIQRAALLDGDTLREVWIHDPGHPDGVGDVYTGRVDAILPALAGRFLDLGGPIGFLPDSAGGKTLSIGTFVTVEVTRAPQGG